MKFFLFLLCMGVLYSCNNHLPEDTDGYVWKGQPKDATIKDSTIRLIAKNCNK